MKKRIIFILAGLLSLATACNNPYEDRLAALRERAEVLQKADAETRKMLTSEMNRLSGDVDDMLAAMEERVLAHLDEMVKKVEAAILDQSSQLNLTIKKQSDALGSDILEWRNNLDAFLEKNTSLFVSCHARLQNELSTAIAASNYDLISRIRKSMTALDELDTKFNSYVKNVQKRVDNLKDMEKVYNSTQKAMSDLRWRKEEMLASMDEYEEILQSLIEERLEATPNQDLCDAVDIMIELYDTASGLYDDSGQYLTDIEDYYSNMPDIESLLSEAEDIISRCSDLDGEIEGIDEGQVEEVIAYLQEALDAAEEGDVSFSDVESTYDEVLNGIHEFLDQTNELLELMDESLSMMEDELGEIDDCISAFS